MKYPPAGFANCQRRNRRPRLRRGLQRLQGRKARAFERDRQHGLGGQGGDGGREGRIATVGDNEDLRALGLKRSYGFRQAFALVDESLDKRNAEFFERLPNVREKRGVGRGAA